MSGSGKMRFREAALASFLLATVVALPLASGAGASTYPGANGKIAFYTIRDGNFEIYAVNPDGSGPVNLTNHASADIAPSWSSDGTKVAFATNRDGNSEIYTMNADGTGLLRLTNNAAVDNDPTWSPNGMKIAFTTNRDGNNEIYTMNADGSLLQNMTNNPASDIESAWSPNSALDKVVFTTNRDGNNEIYVYDRLNVTTTRLTTNAAFDANPNWSPDGLKIAFRTNRDGNNEIYTMTSSSGASLTRLTNNAVSDLAPVFSPDQTKIAFTTDRDGNDEIYTMNADGTLQTRITNDAASDSAPSWQSRYEVPLTASKIDVALVPAYRQTISSTQCTSRGGTPTTHGAPDIPGGASPDLSCSPPGYISGTVAKLGIRSVGSVVMTAVPGNPATLADEADESISTSITDVRNGAASGFGYVPLGANDVSLVIKLRITDTFNGALTSDPATVADVDLDVPFGCVNGGGSLGSTCSVNTSVDGVVPGLLKEGRNTVIDMFRARLTDSGVNGSHGNSDDRVFAQQGTYIP